MLFKYHLDLILQKKLNCQLKSSLDLSYNQQTILIMQNLISK